MADGSCKNKEETGKNIKCLVWDIDNTLWNGILSEDKQVTLRKGVVEVIKTLDERGILQSIASKNNYEDTMEKLKEFNLDEYFIYPQINWNAKSHSIKKIAQLINIGIDTLAFIDDQPAERDEVRFVLPQVSCIDAGCLGTILDMPELNPRFITEDSKLRRSMYQNDILRKNKEESFSGTQEEFLASLEMVLTISSAQEGDLERAEELTVRTHQLNSTGYTYSLEALRTLQESSNHKLLIAGLEDTYGIYGKIGLALVECKEDEWVLKLLLMSCRVMSRGVGTIMLNHIMREAKAANKKLKAEFIPTDRNRMMYITYKFAGFKEMHKDGDMVIFENDLLNIPPYPDYIELIFRQEATNLAF
ncbi:HAD-IIIC family phosphatase [Marinisporobacter balticus]|uniref:HAD superfamily phosphatase (TIGR01681 family)/FkbH-like protein n=1 Tax=Marinisporobacter balticus TaxID=2018667 RepID=A0A4R2KK61_9FIRM|nr:HAD-IIIC family phosphatase [Marinisporobacter balticus]TCO70408.1 HAD superfamily phosphatase (TIGR01681 family)/FkbH-like protein [Marinisporobacter balticus]